MLMSTGLPRPVFSCYADCGGISKGTVSSPVYPKTVSADAELEGKRELYRVRVVNQLAVLLRMRINNLRTCLDTRVAVGRAHYASHARIFFAHVLPNSAEVLHFSAFIQEVKGKIICLCTNSDENLFNSKISGSKLLWLLRYASS